MDRNLPSSTGSAFRSVTDALTHRADVSPHKTAFVFLSNGEHTAQIWSYAQLHERAVRIGQNLARDCKQGDRVLLFHSAGLEFIGAFFGCMLRGFIPVPLPIAYLHSRKGSLEPIMRDACPRAILSDQRSPLLDKVGTCRSHDTESFGWVVGDNGRRSRTEVVNHIKTIAYLQFTSGSTRFPRGVVITHENILGNLRAIDESFQHDSSSVEVCWLPHFHDMGLVYGILQPLVYGFPCCLMSPSHFIERPVRWLRAISRFAGTHAGAPNFAYELCVHKIRSAELQDLDLRSWRVAFNGAEPVRQSTVMSFCNMFGPVGFNSNAMISAYGLSEATLKVSSGAFGQGTRFTEIGRYNGLDDGDATTSRSVASCGAGGRETSIVIVDPHSRCQLKDNEVGEIWVSGPGVSSGYWNSFCEDEDVFGCHLSNETPGRRFLRTGDLGLWHEGELYVVGRLKDRIILNGRNYYPGDLECESSSTHPAVSQLPAAAFCIEKDERQHIVIVQEVRTARDIPYKTIAATIQEQVSHRNDLVVNEVVLVRKGSLPRTTSGKIQRARCKRSYLENKLLTVATFRVADLDSSRNRVVHASTHTRIDMYMRQLIARVFDIPISSADLDGSTVQMGVSSLRAAEISTNIENDLGIHISPSEILAAFTWRELVLHLANTRGGQRQLPAEAPQRNRSGTSRASTEQSRLWMLCQNRRRASILNLVLVVRIDGALDPNDMAQAAHSLLEHHKVLSARFEITDTGLLQVVDPQPALYFRQVDCAHESEAEKVRTQEAIEKHESDLRLALNCGGLFRETLLRWSNERHVLFITAHHIVCDAYSLLLLCKEQIARYVAIKSKTPYLPRGDARPFCPEELYSNSATQDAIEQYLESQCGNSIREYLPCHRDGSSTGSTQTTTTSDLLLPPPLIHMLQDCSRRWRVTPFHIMMAVFQILVAQASGDVNFLVAFAASGRNRLGHLHSIGPYASPKLIAATTRCDRGFKELARNVQTRVVTAMHSNISFVDLVAHLSTLATDTSLPIIPYFFSLIEPASDTMELSGLRIIPSMKQVSLDHFSVAFTCVLARNTGRGAIQTSGGRMSLDPAELAKHYVSILTSCLLSAHESVEESSACNLLS